MEGLVGNRTAAARAGNGSDERKKKKPHSPSIAHHLVHAARAQGRAHRVRHGLGGLNVLDAYVVALGVVPALVVCGGRGVRKKPMLGGARASGKQSAREQGSAPSSHNAQSTRHALESLAPNGGRDGRGGRGRHGDREVLDAEKGKDAFYAQEGAARRQSRSLCAAYMSGRGEELSQVL